MVRGRGEGVGDLERAQAGPEVPDLLASGVVAHWPWHLPQVARHAAHAEHSALRVRRHMAKELL